MGKKAKNNKSSLKKGISVIIPTYKGEKWILTCLNSLANQTLDKNLFEIIIIINGEKDHTEILIDDFQKNHNKINIKKIILEKASASNARNIGISNATRRYSTFIDDDDFVSLVYLDALYKKASKDSIVIGQLVDVGEDNSHNSQNPVNKQVENARLKKSITYEDLIRPLVINALKLIPTNFLKNIFFDQTLKSGEDIVFMTNLLISYPFTIKLTETDQAIYYRVLRPNSVSRQSISFEFNIQGRLAVIQKLNSLFCQTKERSKHEFIKTIIEGQIGFIKKYIDEKPEEYSKVINEIKKHSFLYFPCMEGKLFDKLNTLQQQLKEKNGLYRDTKERLSQANKKYREATNQISTQKQQLATQKQQLATQKQQLATQKQQLATAINKSQKAQANFDQCRASSSYQLGHLILHEIRSIVDIWRLPGKLNKIRHNKSKSELPS